MRFAISGQPAKSEGASLAPAEATRPEAKETVAESVKGPVSSADSSQGFSQAPETKQPAAETKEPAEKTNDSTKIEASTGS
jgi:two-component system nitrogen regulation sensor histidine kinase NtrY